MQNMTGQEVVKVALNRPGYEYKVEYLPVLEAREKFQFYLKAGFTTSSKGYGWQELSRVDMGHTVVFEWVTGAYEVNQQGECPACGGSGMVEDCGPNEGCSEWVPCQDVPCQMCKAQPQEEAPEEAPAADGLEECWRCYGKGIYYGAGYVENGVFKGYSGTCYRCKGKGRVTRIQNEMGAKGQAEYAMTHSY